MTQSVKQTTPAGPTLAPLPIIGLVLLVLGTGCQTIDFAALPPPGPAQAEASHVREAAHALRQANQAVEPREAGALALLAAELIWDLDWSESSSVLHHADQRAESTYNRALLRILELVREGGLDDATEGSIELAGPRGSYRFAVDPGTPAIVERYPEFRIAGDFRSHAGFDRRVARPGIGLPLVAIDRQPEARGGRDDIYRRRAGFTSPRTAILTFGPPPSAGEPREVALAVVDPRRIQEITMGDRILPVAADLTAPLIAAYPEFGGFWRAVWAALRPDRWLAQSDIYAYEHYDPDRIPVVLVHGLISTPGMWKNLVNELQADPDIGKHYRFYVYTYPTSLEPAHSARLLRDTIAEKKNRRKPAQGYLLISHSMGGILSRAQSTEIGRHAWDAQFGNRSEQAWRKTQEDDFVRQMLVFDPDPDIRRLIFIAVPHQGSPMATRQPARILARFIRPPVETTRYLLSSPLVAAGLMDPQAKPTSADGLSPSSPFLQAMADLPTVSPAHSIIGDRGKPGELEMSSDGVVPYWSSHLPFAESERVVPAGHSAYRDAEAIREVMRILREDLRQRPPAGQTQASLTPLNASNPLADADGRNER